MFYIPFEQMMHQQKPVAMEPQVPQSSVGHAIKSTVNKPNNYTNALKQNAYMRWAEAQQ